MTARRGRPERQQRAVPASDHVALRPLPCPRRADRPPDAPQHDLDALLVGRQLMAGQLVVVADRLPMVLALRPCWAGLRDSWRPR